MKSAPGHWEPFIVFADIPPLCTICVSIEFDIQVIWSSSHWQTKIRFILWIKTRDDDVDDETEETFVIGFIPFPRFRRKMRPRRGRRCCCLFIADKKWKKHTQLAMTISK